MIFHLSTPPLTKDLLWFDSRKRPPPVSDHYVFTFWVVAYGKFDCTAYFSSKSPTHPPTQRPIKYLPRRWWLGGGWKSAGGVSCCCKKAVQCPTSLRLFFSQCFVLTLDDEQTARIYSPSSAYFFVV